MKWRNLSVVTSLLLLCLICCQAHGIAVEYDGQQVRAITIYSSSSAPGERSTFRNSAREMTDALRDYWEVQDKHIKSFSPYSVTGEELKTQIIEYSDATDETDILIIYIVSHGGSEESGGGIAFFFETSDDKNHVMYSTLNSWLESAEGTVILIIDACFSAGAHDYIKGDNIWLLASTSSDDQQSFPRAGDTMLFTNSIVASIKRGNLDLREMYDSAMSSVESLGAWMYEAFYVRANYPQFFGPEGVAAPVIPVLEQRQTGSSGEPDSVVGSSGCLIPSQVGGVRAGDDKEGVIDISWIPDSRALFYTVFRSTRRTGSYEELGNSSSRLYQDENLPAGTSFWYKVQACNDCGCGVLSTPREGSTEVACPEPEAPGNLAATDGTHSDRIEINWNSVSGASSYDVYRANSYGGTYVIQDTTTGTSYTESGPALDVHYWYKVQAHNECGGSVFSSPDEGWAEEACDAPAQIVDVSVAENGGSHGSCASFSGQYVAGALSGTNARYELWKSVDGGAWERVAYDTANGTYFGVGDSTSPCSGSRRYRLRACLPCGACGPWSAVYGPYTSP